MWRKGITMPSAKETELLLPLFNAKTTIRARARAVELRDAEREGRLLELEDSDMTICISPR